MTGRDKAKSMKIVPPGKKKCVWMEAGVVSYKLCDNNYDCSTCVYDQAMQVKIARHRADVMTEPVKASSGKFTATWVEKMMQLPASSRKCRYMITGEIGRKICPNAYECGNCSFDQMMQERLQAEVLPMHTSKQVAGFELAEGFYYHEGHTWARSEYGGRVRIGLDDFAQKLIGSPTGIDLPAIGHKVRQDEVGFQITKNGDTVEVLSPIEGIVVHANNQLLDHPELINESCYEKAWLFVIEPTRLRDDLKGLYYGEEAGAFMSEELEKLISIANDDLSLAADGAVPVEDLFAELKGKEWAGLMKIFFKT